MPDIGISNFGTLRIEPIADQAGLVKTEWMRAFINLDATVSRLSAPPTTSLEVRLQAIIDGSDDTRAATASAALASLTADPTLAALLNNLQSLGLL